ncbi:hypothetical protein QC763_603368 [Podospora pseudopauciseta]|uniref:Uncharacterized protein n=1 Tax=Podospora pseudopauciseta TaxID=2093780 RepID=A0ABR0H4D5_9PEZI|nr:hypothetical protein QC763_603368 [Podospora pseudopauciseta]
MISIITLVASALAFFGIAQDYTLPDNIPDVTWNLLINPANKSSATVSFTGTIEQAVAKMENDYSGWNAALLAQSAAHHAAHSALFGVKADSKPLRINFDPTNCTNPNFPPFSADTARIREGIRYLLGVSGTAKNGPGPGNCGRVSCSYYFAIYCAITTSSRKRFPGWKSPPAQVIS